jgi:hypothetical protein
MIPLLKAPLLEREQECSCSLRPHCLRESKAKSRGGSLPIRQYETGVFLQSMRFEFQISPYAPILKFRKRCVSKHLPRRATCCWPARCFESAQISELTQCAKALPRSRSLPSVPSSSTFSLAAVCAKLFHVLARCRLWIGQEKTVWGQANGHWKTWAAESTRLGQLCLQEEQASISWRKGTHATASSAPGFIQQQIYVSARSNSVQSDRAASCAPLAAVPPTASLRRHSAVVRPQPAHISFRTPAN